jgi:hypothetical protein
MYNRLENVLLGHYAFHVLNQLESLVDFFVFEVVNYKVQASLRDYINEGWQDLESVLTASKDNQVVSYQVVVLKDVACRGSVLEGFELSLGRLSII